MKNLMYLFLCLSFAISCTDTNSNSTTEKITLTGDVSIDAITQLFSYIKGGLKPNTPIANRVKFDKNTTARTWKNEPTGDFLSEQVVGDYDVWYDYVCLEQDKENLESVKVSVALQEDIETSDERRLSEDKMIALISKELGKEPTYDKDNEEYHWKVADIDYIFNAFDEYSFEFGANTLN